MGCSNTRSGRHTQCKGLQRIPPGTSMCSCRRSCDTKSLLRRPLTRDTRRCLCIRLGRRPQSLVCTCRRTQRASCSTPRSPHISGPARGSGTRQYLDNCAHPPRSQGSRCSHKTQCCLCSAQTRHMVCICTHCHRAYYTLFLPSRHCSGTGSLNRHR